MSHRDRPDKCPGALTPHLAEDGAISRLRFPGGHLHSSDFATLADLAEQHGDGNLHLTSRGNIQVRGTTASFAGAAAAFVPYPEHDRMRNILSSPLTGRSGGHADVTGLVHEVDAALCSRPELATLPGRTLFAVDDGRGDVLAEAPDLGLLALPDGSFELIAAGQPAGKTAPRSAAVQMLVDASLDWARTRGTAWRMEEVFGGGERREADRPIGWIEQDDGRVSLAAGLRFGVLPAQMARMISVMDVPVHVTPWYSLVFHDFEEAVAEQVVRVLAPNGFEFDERSPWLRVTACTGKPGCASALSDVRRDVRENIHSLPDGRIHFSGCERRCGAPKTPHLEYLATGDGEYDVTP